MEKVDHEFQKQWLSELRSGLRAQTRNHLKTDTGFCCQGVACEINDPDGWIPIPNYIDDINVQNIIVYSWKNSSEKWGNTATWPTGIRKSLGLTHEQGQVLSKSNDRGKSFSDIADQAEQYMHDNNTHWESIPFNSTLI